MRIGNLTKRSIGDRVRVAAVMVWEDCDHPMREIYFETDARFDEDVACDPHAFLLAGGIQGMRPGNGGSR